MTRSKGRRTSTTARIGKPKNWNSRLDLADRADRMNEVAGVVDPAGPKVSDVIAERAKSKHDRRQKAEAAKTIKPAPAATHVHVGGITVNAHPHHDEGKIADMVHRKFNEAAQRQLTDGVYV